MSVLIEYYSIFKKNDVEYVTHEKIIELVNEKSNAFDFSIRGIFGNYLFYGYDYKTNKWYPIPAKAKYHDINDNNIKFSCDQWESINDLIFQKIRIYDRIRPKLPDSFSIKDEESLVIDYYHKEQYLYTRNIPLSKIDIFPNEETLYQKYDHCYGYSDITKVWQEVDLSKKYQLTKLKHSYTLVKLGENTYSNYFDKLKFVSIDTKHRFINLISNSSCLINKLNIMIDTNHPSYRIETYNDLIRKIIPFYLGGYNVSFLFSEKLGNADLVTPIENFGSYIRFEVTPLSEIRQSSLINLINKVYNSEYHRSQIENIDETYDIHPIDERCQALEKLNILLPSPDFQKIIANIIYQNEKNPLLDLALKFSSKYK